MPRSPLETRIFLPPAPLASGVARRILELTLGTFQWFKPVRFGSASLDRQHVGGQLDLAALLAYYEENGHLCVAGRTDRDFLWILPASQGMNLYHGKLTWVTSVASVRKPGWLEAHARQVAELMRVVDSPLSQASIESDVEQKTQRWVPDGVSEVLTFTIRNYSEGLAGLFWRNFYGPPFVRLFGERLNALPPECVTRLGEELVLVQPYELPTEAGTEAARAREQQLISLLGSECFYDHEHHRPPTRRPVLEPEPGSGP